MSKILDALKKLEEGDAIPSVSGNLSPAPAPPDSPLASNGMVCDSLYRLETTIALWDEEVVRVHRELTDRIVQVEDRLQRRTGDPSALAAAQKEITRLKDALAEAERIRDDCLAELEEARDRAARQTAIEEQRLADVELIRTELAGAQDQIAAARALSAKIDELRALWESEQTRADALEEDLVRAHGMLTEAPHPRSAETEPAREDVPAAAGQSLAAQRLSERVEDLERQLEEERARADLLEERFRVRQREVSAAAGQQLALALRDRDEAHQEIVRLRSEIDMLHRVNVSLNMPAPSSAAAMPPAFEVYDADGNKRRMGEILISLGLLTQEQLHTALGEQVVTPQRRIGAICVEKGYVSEDAVARILARQLELPFVRLAPGVVDAGAPRLINGQLAKHRQCIPVTVTADRVVLAMANPLDLIALDDVELASGRRVSPVVATGSDIVAAINLHYGTA